MKLLILGLVTGIYSFAASPQSAQVSSDARVVWRENSCEGFGPGDCSVRAPQTANVVVYLSGREEPVRFLVRCQAKGCRAGAAEVEGWVKRAREKEN
jgi:hypothetical protein